MSKLGKFLGGAAEAVEQVALKEHQAGLIRGLETMKHELALQRDRTLSELRQGERRGAAELQLEYAPKLADVEVAKQRSLYEQVEQPKIVESADLQWRNSAAGENLRAEHELDRVKAQLKGQFDVARMNRASAERIAQWQVGATLASLRNQGLSVQVDKDGYGSVVNMRDGTVKRLVDEEGKPWRSSKEPDSGLKLLGSIAQLGKVAADSEDTDGAKFWSSVAQRVMGDVLGGRGITMPGSEKLDAGGGNAEWDNDTGAVTVRGATIGRASSLTEAKAMAARADANARKGPTATVGGFTFDAAPDPSPQSTGLIGRAMASGAASGGNAAVEEAGSAIDQARAAVQAARSTLLSYGAAKRRDDPAGFERARLALAQAEAAEAEAMRRYQGALGPVKAAGR